MSSPEAPEPEPEEKKAPPKRKAGKSKKKKKKAKAEKPSLVIVESAAKAKSIGKYLGRKYHVLSCMGHLVDLPKSELGVDLEKDFTPRYITIRGKGKILQELRKAAKKSARVFAATDPDREGEAIGWHLERVLRIHSGVEIRRVSFNEVTPKAVKEAVENPRDFDLNMVNAQQARRVLDRLVGYMISPLLWTTIRRGLSAGRVQSVALRIVCEREAAVLAFKPVEYWSLHGTFKTDSGGVFEAEMDSLDGEAVKPTSAQEAEAILAKVRGSTAAVEDLTRQARNRNPPAPFTTSKLQQAASSRLRMNLRRVMQIAQALYEGMDVPDEGPVGLITYMRTDSRRIAPSAQEEARTFIEKTYGAAALPASAPQYKNKAGAQDAHEAIRPTSVTRTPDALASTLDVDQSRLYLLIWQTFVASQMAPARYEATSVSIKAGPALFKASWRVLEDPGFLRAMPDLAEPAAPGPALEKGQPLEILKLERVQHFTEPPPRFTEATLVKELEENGIGRPSTYAPTVGVLVARGYLKKEQGARLIPTELGTMVDGLLLKNFPKIVDVGFTAEMERGLDTVEAGGATYLATLNSFYGSFKGDVEKAKAVMAALRETIQQSGENCPDCGKPLLIKWSRHGKFLGCSGYPECKHTRAMDGTETIDLSGRKCPKCQAAVRIKSGRFGAFLSCERYPDCDYTGSLPIGVACPKGCGGDVVVRSTRRGRRFYGCDKYPTCDFRSWSKPLNQPCGLCGSNYMLHVVRFGNENVLCPNEACPASRAGSTNVDGSEEPAQEAAIGTESAEN